MSSPLPRVLVVGRSPSVLIATRELLRGKGYTADATNGFDTVLIDYDPADLDVVVFGGMVAADAKQRLRNEFTERNPAISFVQGLVGIPGVIAAQVDAVAHDDPVDDRVDLLEGARDIRLELASRARVTVEAFWMTSWTPPEPTSTSTVVFTGDLPAGTHDIRLDAGIPSEGSFVVVTLDDSTWVMTIGAVPEAVRRMAPRSSSQQTLPPVAAVTTHADHV